MKTNKKELTLADLRNVRGAAGDSLPIEDDWELRVAEPIESTEKERNAAESRAK